MQGPKLIVTLGPATWSMENLRKIKDKGVDLVRINMSHSTIDDLSIVMKNAKSLGLPFIVDTEGSQLRTGRLKSDVDLNAGTTIRLYVADVMGDELGVTMKPAGVVDQLRIGDLLFVGFGTLVLRVTSTLPLAEGHILADVLSAGTINQNKAVVVVAASPRDIVPPVLTGKDYQSIALGLQEGAEYLALSYVRRGDDVDVVRRATGDAMGIISKIEAWEGLQNFDDIAMKSDYLLLDRGDMSKEVPIEQIPLIQKNLIARARALNVPIYVATNFLESMVVDPKPTRAEVSDVVNTILDGADGLILSAETAVGAYPFECINMMKRLIARTKSDVPNETRLAVDNFNSLGLEPSHGGPLVDGFVAAPPPGSDRLHTITVSDDSLSDLEQIATGAYSPLQGFMGEADFYSVIDRMRLSNGVVWPVPIVLDVTENAAEDIVIGDEVLLCARSGDSVGVLQVGDIYRVDRDRAARTLAESTGPNDSGVRKISSMGSVLLGGSVKLWHQGSSDQRAFELSPRQTRRVFENRGWSKVVGFENGDVNHLRDERLHRFVLGEHHCDGLLVQLNASRGSLETDAIVSAYQSAIRLERDADKIVFGLNPIVPHGYGDIRETILRAIVGKNFGCSNFVVDRDLLSEKPNDVQTAKVISDLGVALMTRAPDNKELARK
jgi:pyruvate kinase